MPRPVFKKGHLKVGGRQKGSINKFTTLKQAFIGAFNSPELRGEAGLTDWAKLKKNQTEFYRLLSKLFPAEVKVGGDGAPIQVITGITRQKGDNGDTEG